MDRAGRAEELMISLAVLIAVAPVFHPSPTLLSVLAPNPFEKPLRLDTATLHKATMIVATAGMATQIVLGILTAGKEGTLAQRNFAVAHQIVGYTTLAATAAGFLVLTF